MWSFYGFMVGCRLSVTAARVTVSGLIYWQFISGLSYRRLIKDSVPVLNYFRWKAQYDFTVLVFISYCFISWPQ